MNAFKLSAWSTCIYVIAALVAIIGVTVFVSFNDTSSITVAHIILFTVGAAIALAAFAFAQFDFFPFGVGWSLAFIISIMAFLPAANIRFSDGDVPLVLIAIFQLIAVIGNTLILATEAKEKGAQESFLVRFLAAFPGTNAVYYLMGKVRQARVAV